MGMKVTLMENPVYFLRQKICTFPSSSQQKAMTHEKEGADNKGFDDSEVVNQSANKSILSTFKPQGNKSPQKRNGLKIMFIDHQTEAVQSDSCSDSFEEVDLKENANNI